MARQTYDGTSALKQSINELIDTMPSSKLIEIYDYVRFLHANTPELSLNEMDCYTLSESALAKSWLSEEEDDFWKDL